MSEKNMPDPDSSAANIPPVEILDPEADRLQRVVNRYLKAIIANDPVEMTAAYQAWIRIARS